MIRARFRWPRGRYNNRRIVGLSFKIVIDITHWNWIPLVGLSCGAFHWLCFLTWTGLEYESHGRATQQSRPNGN